ncbi:MAG: protein kinase [Deltaproteobacteria bacterium]|jgi:serine/threonine-protein kinase|nr:protein kinase [Deltaproteobacteria bacterium]
MPTKVLLHVRKGSLAGKTFAYDARETLIVGRQEDSSIVLPESTVSRYHCLIDVIPPSVMVRDFCSLNGTFLNGRKIGQREPGSSPEAAGERQGSQFSLKPGDRLGIGKDCELELEVVSPSCSAGCFAELEGPAILDQEKLSVCPDCHDRLGEARRDEEAASKAKTAKTSWKPMEKAGCEADEADAKSRVVAKEARPLEPEEAAELEQVGDGRERERRKPLTPSPDMAGKNQACEHECAICGRTLVDGGTEPDICPDCQADPKKILMFLMDQAQIGLGGADGIAGYRNIRMLGQGGMGQVWMVEEEKTGERMALKVMLPRAKVDDRSKAIFLREAHFSGQLRHRNIVRHHGSGQSRDTYFILMELCEGGSVDKLMEKKGGRLGLELAVCIALQVLDGFIYAHGATLAAKLANGEEVSSDGLVHRDFKPGNILLANDGKRPLAKVADFGLAKAFETSGLSGHTLRGMVAGTPVFMPRQQIINYRDARPEVDVWAVAASLYFMLAGTYPKDFSRGRDPFAVALNTEAVPVRKRNPQVPERLANVLDAALRDRPRIGVRTAAELKMMIEEAL